MQQKSSHILNTSANLLGLCFIVFTGLKTSGIAVTSHVDEITALATLFFMTSCLFSFFGIRSNLEIRQKIYESIADYVFMSGLLALFVIVVLIVFKFIK